MRLTRITACLLFASALAFSLPLFGQNTSQTQKEFSATAEVTTSQGTRSMPVTLIVARPLSAAQARPLKKVLEAGGQQALMASIRGGNRGRLSLGGIEAPLDLVIAEPAAGATQYVVVTTRNLKFEEVNENRETLDYPFTVVVFSVPEFGSGEGQLYLHCALSINENGRVRVEHYEDQPGTLKDIRAR
jgi:hypothetical protein